MLNAIHAAISAADAVCVALGGVRSTDSDHQRAVALLLDITAASPDVRPNAKALRELLSRKNAVEYESRPATQDEAVTCVKQARRLVDWSRATVESVLPPTERSSNGPG
jgi:hypothetical protein